MSLKLFIHAHLIAWGINVTDFGAKAINLNDDYPDFVVPMAQAVARHELDRGIAICSSGIGASIAANKVPGARAALINDHFSAHQGVEDDDLNILCLGGHVTGTESAREFVRAFLDSSFSGEERHIRRLNKVKSLENLNTIIDYGN